MFWSVYFHISPLTVIWTDLILRFTSFFLSLKRLEPEVLKKRLAFKVAEEEMIRARYRGDKSMKDNLFSKTSFPREGDVENPWHIMDFSKFIEYASSRPKLIGEKFGYITDKHFAPYYSIKPLSPCNIQYDVIIKQEFLGEELG